MSTLLQVQKRAFILFLLALLILFLFLLKPFLLSITLGAILVILFYPIYLRLLRAVRGRRYVASAFTTFTMIAFLVLPATIITTLVIDQLSSVVDRVMHFVETGELMALLQKWNVNGQHYLQLIEQRLNFPLNIKGMVGSTVRAIFSSIPQYSPAVLGQTVSFILQGFITLIVVFFLFVEGSAIYHEFIAISPLKDSHENALAIETRNMIYSVIYGSFFTALAQGCLAGIAFYFLKIEGALVWGSVTFMFSFIPLLGATTVWLPASIILLLLGDMRGGIFLMIYGVLVISGIDNILKPMLMKGKNQVHPVLLFLTIMGGLKLFGPLGILLGPIITAVFIAAIKIYKQEYLPTDHS